ncbi:putative toxin-antitoxin system toxin component, PIN family [Candidatus Gottesmanbacteria bacterium RIFCSPLOWO2_01_FULL_46_21]|uniref:Putative toxin-antitoxin system toxin component, PIN family n=1 Tax=Candidatus Gottesmanbacteria bacterium RIFCSPLOWO2_01_FULL_46_21 TaxID=1798393 RepID=A0A1F6AYV1_9BACT|nr:MAG: putative toxin-antitoxin system toxin component, PIN family [Candidatus Gottesmanbacteria bacterium RIFCSPLOWO2_01_FULL_46_21]
MTSTIRILLDTNVIISAVLFGGNPRIILEAIRKKEFTAVTSTVLLSELADVLRKKFSFSQESMTALDMQLQKLCVLVSPPKSITILADIPDNRVLEAAVEGECTVIITGDKELLALKIYQHVRILTPDIFLKTYTISH